MIGAATQADPATEGVPGERLRYLESTLLAMDEHDIRLDKARRQVAEAELRVVRQKALVEDTRRQGRSTERAEQLLAALETSLDAMCDNLKIRTECLLQVRLGKWFRTLWR